MALLSRPRLNLFSIGVTQYVGTPLYLINKDHYYRFMAFTKQCMTLLVVSMTQWWTTTTVHVSGDASMRGQIHRLPDGRLRCTFASRMVLIANHQVTQNASLILPKLKPCLISAVQRLDLPLVDRLHQPPLHPRPRVHCPQRIHPVHSPRRPRSPPRRLRLHVPKHENRHPAPDPSARPTDPTQQQRRQPGSAAADVADDVPRGY